VFHKPKSKVPDSKSSDTASSSRPANLSPVALRDQPADRRLWLTLSIVVLILSCGLLFFRLEHYSLWYDEADTALFARGIARTGDTLALIDHNLYAYQHGALLKNLHSRYQPPVPYYLAAPFVGVNGTGTFWPRFPFAFCGLLSVALLMYWMSRSRLSAATWIVFSVGLLSNVSFFLFCRQCRYFSLIIFLSIVIVYFYMNWKGRWWEYLGIVLASILLLGTNYLSYAALYVVLGCDYLLFARRQLRLTIGQLLLIFGPQLLVGAGIMWVFNPFGTEVAPDMPGRNLILDKLELLWWNFRDLNDSEFYVGIVMLAALPVYLWTRNIWLLRGIIALVCYVVTIVIFSPQHVSITYIANVRYLIPLIPLCVGISALVIAPLARYRWPLALVFALLVFGPNVLNYPLSPHEWCCRPAEFVEELWEAFPTSIDVAAKWINDNVKEGDSILVAPDYMLYSLIYHAPKPVYAWQLEYPPQEQFASLPLIHFRAQVAPKYFIIFGPLQMSIEMIIHNFSLQGLDYKVIKRLDIYWADETRPEITLRSFHSKKDYNPQTEAVYVLRLEKSRQGK
jgi:hypothetical protein